MLALMTTHFKGKYLYAVSVESKTTCDSTPKDVISGCSSEDVPSIKCNHVREQDNHG